MWFVKGEARQGFGLEDRGGTVRGAVLGRKDRVYKNSQKSKKKLPGASLLKALYLHCDSGRGRRESNNCSPIESSECLGSFLSYQADFKHFLINIFY